MKNPKRTLIINLVLALLLTGVLIGASFVDKLNDASVVLSGFSFGISDGDGCLTSDESYERGSEGEVSASDLQSLDIGWTAGQVRLVLSEGETVRFYEESGKALEEKQIMRWKSDNGTLRIRFGTKGGLFRNEPEKTLTVELPSDWIAKSMTLCTVSASLELPSVQATDFNIDTVSGNIRAESVTADTISLNSVSGEIKLNKLECDRLSVDCVSGEISLQNAAVTAELDGSTVSGSVSFSGSARELSWDTVSGDAEFVFTAAPSSIEIDSTSGDATVTLPADVSGFKAELDATSGDISCDFDVSHRGDYVEYGDGALEIEMDSTSGDLKIKK